MHNLKDVVVLTVNKSYWASEECRVFPNRLYAWQFYGHSQNNFNSFFIFLRGVLYWLIYRPRIIFFGSSHRIIPWFVQLKKRGWLGKTKLIATHQVYFPDESLEWIERVILTSHQDVANRAARNGHPEKYAVFPHHADGDYSQYDTAPQDYIFSGGRASRDFPSLIEAVRGMDVRLRIITHIPEYLEYEGELPENVEVFWKMPLDEFLGHAAGALFVVVPLKSTADIHGISTIVQAMSLGKVIISNLDIPSSEYLEDGKTAILVRSGDVEGYRKAIHFLLDNPDKRQEMEANVREAARNYTYEVYTQNIVKVCEQASVHFDG
ncbi:MAG TPA: glycosyltransferase [Aggregatilineales bacterium]|nr:glycosyltransferase [Aggregatilineales bacterium]